MNQTFIDMLVAIKDPVAIERAYNIVAAKRELLVVGAGEGASKSTFQHSVMEPRPVPKTFGKSLMEHLGIDSSELSDLLAKTYSQVRLGQEQARQKELRERGTYKLLPSMRDVLAHQGVRGKFLIRLKDVTPAMARNGFHNGMVFKLVRGGNQTSTLRHVRSGRVAVIHNHYLEPFATLPAYQGPANVTF